MPYEYVQKVDTNAPEGDGLPADVIFAVRDIFIKLLEMSGYHTPEGKRIDFIIELVDVDAGDMEGFEPVEAA